VSKDKRQLQKVPFNTRGKRGKSMFKKYGIFLLAGSAAGILSSSFCGTGILPVKIIQIKCTIA
jgi:uncharacterized protein YigE (DUF2233 family)